MTILLCVTVMLVVGIVFLVCFDEFSTYNIVGVILTIVGGIGFMVVIITLPVERAKTNSGIQQFNSVKISIKQARIELNIESAATYMKIIDANKWLVNKKYWNKTLFDLWIPDAVEKLEPLK